MITYTWGISRMECAPLENNLINVVKVIYWNLTGQDENGVSASINNSYPLPSPNPETFINYSNLTEEDVVNWLKNNLDTGYLETLISSKIGEHYNGANISFPLPWENELISQPTIEESPVL